MKINYLELAKLEFHDSIKYYEQQEKELGIKFKNDIQASINRIKNFPNAYQKISNEIRRCTLHRFPYNILYMFEENSILIIAIAHQHRIPEYWVDRV
ncbi:type II toxin-antitoxin system RelE/ParE family toxin [Arcobacter sp.]|uniref:type II toxin-antitoxin system RelE/ParE family toxin n=1 Tax=Arcobacter sp. TaxID=1872629 RepID=UPI003C734358